MSEAVKAREQQSGRSASCRHHWLIQAPNGATSQGICKRCGARRDFPNAAADALWEREGLGRWSRGGTSRPISIKLSEIEEDEED
jgi:hypothetical protein